MKYSIPFANMKTWFLLSLLIFILSACKAVGDANSGEEPVTKNINATQQMKLHDHSQHHHGMLDIDQQWPEAPVPQVSLNITPDSMSGWNIYVDTKHFSFSPASIDQNAVANQGHAHLYVDNYKMARLYGHWYHLKKLTPGKHEVRVTLNANDHSTLSVMGKKISAITTIEQK